MLLFKRLFIRLFYGFVFALPLMLLTFAIALAGSPQPQAEEPPRQPVCEACHETFQKSWEAGSHAMAGEDPAFLEAWQAQGENPECMSCHATGYDMETQTWMEDGVTCQACHDATNANHPMEPMAAERSAKLCGECHAETFFEWQVSAHRENGLDCIGCHDPHGTELKSDDKALQCASCHRDRASNFAHSQHSQEGLSCQDCHLTELPDPAQEGHARLDHSFNVRLSTCNSCHAYQMHDPVDVHPDNPTPEPPDALAAVETLEVTEEPTPVSPVGFATLSGIFGLAAGAILAPWLDHRFRSRDK